MRIKTGTQHWTIEVDKNQTKDGLKLELELERVLELDPNQNQTITDQNLSKTGLELNQKMNKRMNKLKLD